MTMRAGTSISNLSLSTVLQDIQESAHAESRGKERQLPRDLTRATLVHGLPRPAGEPFTQTHDAPGWKRGTYQTFRVAGSLGCVCVRAMATPEGGWRLVTEGPEDAPKVVTQWLSGWLGDFDLEGKDGAEEDALPSVLKAFSGLVRGAGAPVLMPTMAEGSGDGAEAAAAASALEEEAPAADSAGAPEEEGPTSAAVEDYFESAVATRPHYHVVCKGGELFWLGVEPAEGGGQSVHVGVGALCAAAGAVLSAEAPVGEQEQPSVYGLTYSVVETVWPAPLAGHPAPLQPTTRLTTVVVEDCQLQRNRSAEEGVLEGMHLKGAIAAAVAWAEPAAEGGGAGGAGGAGGGAASAIPPKIYLGAGALGADKPPTALLLSKECAEARGRAKMEALGHIRMREVGLPVGALSPRTWVRRLVMRERQLLATEAAMQEGEDEEGGEGGDEESVPGAGPEEGPVSQALSALAAGGASAHHFAPSPLVAYSPYSHSHTCLNHHSLRVGTTPRARGSLTWWTSAALTPPFAATFTAPWCAAWTRPHCPSPPACLAPGWTLCMTTFQSTTCCSCPCQQQQPKLRQQALTSFSTW